MGARAILIFLLLPGILLADGLTFPWGATFSEVEAMLGAKSAIVKVEAGKIILARSNGVTCQYSFHLPERVAAIDLQRGSDGKIISQKIKLEPAGPPEQATLFAVQMTYPEPLDPSAFQNILLPELKKLYGKAANKGDLSFDFENQTTYVRAYFMNYRQKKYLQRLVFNSIELANQQKMDAQQLKDQIDEMLRQRLADEKGNGALAAPSGLSAEMLTGE